MNEMNITSAQYIQDEESQNISVKITLDGVSMGVPLEPANRHYAEILKQVADGDLTIAEAD